MYPDESKRGESKAANYPYREHENPKPPIPRVESAQGSESLGSEELGMTHPYSSEYNIPGPNPDADY